MKLDYFLYMAEAEGCDNWVSTKTARLNAAVKDFRSLVRDNVDINDYSTQEAVLANHGLSLDDLSDDDKEYIARKVGN